MGEVDKSDQFLSYHSVLHKIVWYWRKLILSHDRHSSGKCICPIQFVGTPSQL